MSRNKESFYSNMKSLSLYHMLGFSPCFHKIPKELKRTSTTTYSLNYRCFEKFSIFTGKQ